MRAVDTNVLVRLIVRDDPAQTRAAEEFVAPGAWVAHLVLVETLWVLDSVYGLQPPRIGTTVEMLLEHDRIVLQDADVVRAALREFRQHSVGFPDCMIVAAARKAGHVPVGTFDRTMSRMDNVTGL